MAILAALEKQKKDDIESEKDDIVSFYDPKDDRVTNGRDVNVPARSWKMSESTKAWLTAGHSEKTKGELLKAVDEAEAQGKTHYVIPWTDAGRGEEGFYIIDFGLIQGGGKGRIPEDMSKY